MWEVTHVL